MAPSLAAAVLVADVVFCVNSPVRVAGKPEPPHPRVPATSQRWQIEPLVWTHSFVFKGAGEPVEYEELYRRVGR